MAIILLAVMAFIFAGSYVQFLQWDCKNCCQTKGFASGQDSYQSGCVCYEEGTPLKELP